jgi:alpha-N-arabinofuranosidase
MGGMVFGSDDRRAVTRRHLARGAIVLGMLLVVQAVSPTASGQSRDFEATVRIERGAGTSPVNPLVLGNNLQWVDEGDNLLRPGTLAFDPARLALIEDMAPTILRYPGGTLTDTYHWREGLGPASGRGTLRDLSNRRKPVLFGTEEFVRLADRLNADIVLTANVHTSTPSDIVDWLAHINAGTQGAATPRVRYLEVGNEPYLIEAERRDLHLSPQEFVARANAVIAAVRSADSRIKVGIPLRSDRIGNLPATPMQGYNDTVLSGLTEPIDFVALHNAYLPFANQNTGTLEEMYWAAMAAHQVIKRDFEATRRQLATHLPGQDVKLAVTEYNAMFTLGKGETDALLASLGGALFVADAIRLFAETDDLLFANYWSLLGNWYFGALDQQGRPRPVYHVLSQYRSVLTGNRLALDIVAPTFDSPRIGAVPATTGEPLISGLATLNEAGLHVVLINKSLRQFARVTLDAGDHAVEQGELGILSAESALAGTTPSRPFAWRSSPLVAENHRIQATLPPHSFSVFRFP